MSTTLNNGGKFISQYNHKTKKFTDLEYEGDIYFGRTGRYTTSFFLLVQLIVNKIVNKTFKESLNGLLELLKFQEESMNGLKGEWFKNCVGDKIYFQNLIDLLRFDINEILQKLNEQQNNKTINDYQIMIEQFSLKCLEIKTNCEISDKFYLQNLTDLLTLDINNGLDFKKTIEELALRCLDIQVHLPLAFTICNNPCTEQELRKQKESLMFLNAYEKKLSQEKKKVKFGNSENDGNNFASSSYFNNNSEESDDEEENEKRKCNSVNKR
ncbi:hypothetical protein ABK040_006121 [Willaertia magna]